MSTFVGEYPPFNTDSNGAILVVLDTGSTTPSNQTYQYPPFLVNENGAILIAVGS